MSRQPSGGTDAPAAGGGRPVEIFFSYAREDDDLRDEVEKYLKVLQRQGLISNWHDRRISPAQEWAGEIDAHLDAAQIILLLVSQDFIASDYIWDVELRRAMERHEKGEARVIPVILRRCDWQRLPFSRLQALPRDARPVAEWPNRDAALMDVSEGIRQVVEALHR